MGQFGRTLVFLQCQVSPPEAERMGNVMNCEQHSIPLSLAPTSSEAGGGLPSHPHAHPRMKFSTAMGKGQIAGRVSWRRVGVLCDEVAGRMAESSHPSRKRSHRSWWAVGVLTQGEPQPWILTLHRTSHCPRRNTSGTVFPC